MPSAPAAPAATCAPERGDPEPAPEPAPDPARTTAKASARSSESPIAVVSLLLGRCREPHHWLITAHGDPAGLAARLQGTLAEFAPAASTGSHSSASTATSATAKATPYATARAELGARERASPTPANGASPPTSSKARSTASSKATTKAGTSPSPKQLLQRAFSDCTALDRPDPPSGASYRYRLSLPSGRLASASLACWRRYSPGGAWQRRCGPMGLAQFLDHHGNPSNHL